MKRRDGIYLALLLMFAIEIGATACGKGDAGGVAPVLEPVMLEHDHECAACGMVVMEQTVARAQLLHRDGTREFFCSLGDMFAYMDAPSPHGKILGSWVETMDLARDPREFTVDKRPWIATDKASYVIGIEKERVMGTPIMVYATMTEAQRVAKTYGGSAVDWSGLRAGR